MWKEVDKGLKGGNKCLRKHCSEVLKAKGKEIVLKDTLFGVHTSC